MTSEELFAKWSEAIKEYGEIRAIHKSDVETWLQAAKIESIRNAYIEQVRIEKVAKAKVNGNLS